MRYLRNFDVTFEPIDQWPGAYTTNRKKSPFGSPWSATLALLDKELWQLQARGVLIRCGLDRGRIRQDGAPRADARMPPPIIVSFDSKHGPLSYPCDQFNDWQDNIRAIALALEALRKVDRYGVTKRAEQYRGWQQLPSPTASPGDEIKTPIDAKNFLRRVLGGRADGLPLVAALREAQMATHPDRGGNPDDFKRVMKCERVLLQEGVGA